MSCNSCINFELCIIYSAFIYTLCLMYNVKSFLSITFNFTCIISDFNPGTFSFQSCN